MDLILALDQSTSGSKAMIVDSYGNILFNAQKEHKQFYPKPGWVEHDPEEIYNNAVAILKEVIKKSRINPKNLRVLAITNQRETIVIWDKSTGIPVYPAIVWQCRRTSAMCKELKDIGLENLIREKTGLVIDSYFSATKLKWIFDNIDGVHRKAEKGKLLAGTIDSWLIWKLTGGKVHATDFTNASRTMLFNIKKLKWDEELLRIFNINSTVLPEVKFSDEIYGITKKGILNNLEIPISGVIGDSQGALFGQNCFEKGMIKATYGTGTSVMMYTEGEIVEPTKGLITSIAWGMYNKVEYAIEGIIISTGDTLNWLKDNLGIIKDFDEVTEIAESLKSNEGVYLIPAFNGLGIPYWDMDARAAIIGLSRKSNKNNLVRSAIESTAFQVKDAVEVICKESKINPIKLHSDGGLTKSKFFMQFQADILNLSVVSTKIIDISLIGSVYLAGLAVNIWKDVNEIRTLRGDDLQYNPNMAEELRDKYYREWKIAVSKVLTKP